MPKLNYYVGEVQCCSSIHATWTIKAHSLADAKRKLRMASGTAVIAVAKINEFPTRHWKAG